MATCANGPASRVAEALTARAQQTAEHLLPNGTLQGREWCAGSIAGEAGRSLKVNLQSGKWKDFADAGKGGDLLDLWAVVRCGGTLKTAIAEAAQWLGIDEAQPAERRTHARVVSPAKRTLREPPKAHPTLGRASATWTYNDADGAPSGLVMRFDTATGKEYRPYDLRADTWSMKAPRPLYRLDTLNNLDPVTLVEGEKCAEALANLGILSTSIMGGAQAVGQADLAPLAGRTVYLWRDNDQAGEKWLADMVEALRDLDTTCRVVPIPTGKPEKWDAADAMAEGWTIDEVRELLELADTSARPRGEWRMWALDELGAVPPVKYAIKPLWVERGVSVIGGPSGSGKSVLALDLALRRATGKSLHAESVAVGGVVYVAAEGFTGLAARAHTWGAYHATNTKVPFAILQAAPQLLDADHVAKLLDLIRRQPFPVTAVVLDTLARSFVGKNENSEDMGAFVDAAHRIAATIDGHVCVLHHTPLADDTRLRGHTSLLAAADTVVICSKLDSFIDVTCIKQKDDEDFQQLHWQVLTHAGSILAAPIGAEERNKPTMLGPKASQAFGVLKQAGDAGLTYKEWAIAAEMKEVTFKKARKQIQQLGLLDQVGRKYKAKPSKE